MEVPKSACRCIDLGVPTILNKYTLWRGSQICSRLDLGGPPKFNTIKGSPNSGDPFKYIYLHHFLGELHYAKQVRMQFGEDPKYVYISINLGCPKPPNSTPTLCFL